MGIRQQASDARKERWAEYRAMADQQDAWDSIEDALIKHLRDMPDATREARRSALRRVVPGASDMYVIIRDDLYDLIDELITNA